MEEVLSNPFFEKIKDYTLFTTVDDIKNLKASKSLSIKGEEISIEFLKRVLLDEKYYNYALKYFNGTNDRFVLSSIINGDIGSSIEYNKSNLFYGLKKISKILQADKKVIDRFETLKEALYIDKYVILNKDKEFELEIENVKYKEKILALFEFMNLKEEYFKKICESDDIKTINDMPKDRFLYMVKTFLEKNKILENHIVTDSIQSNYLLLKQGQIIDIEALNKHLNTVDKKYKYVKLDKKLEQEIISNMPSNLNNLEKSMYIYMKMCKTLSYDDEYYAVDQKGDAVEKHQNIDYITNITLDNPKAVCFEFNVIYTKFLNDLGINFESNYKNMYGEAYGDAHVELGFRVGKFLVNADSVTTILGGDLVRSKLNQPVIGLTCINKNNKTKEEFNKCLNHVNNIILKEYKIKETNKEESLDDLLKEYETLTNNIKEVKIQDKFDLLLEKINLSNMRGIDSYYYIMQMKKILFTDEELVENFAFNLIRTNLPQDEEKTAGIVGIFTVNDYNINEYADLNKYYLLTENNEVKAINKELIENKFESGEYDFIKKTDYGIPGVVSNRRR